MIKIRCKGNLFARYDPDKDTYEVKCKRRCCGARSGVVVLHTFDAKTGVLLETRRFADPAYKRRGF